MADIKKELSTFFREIKGATRKTQKEINNAVALLESNKIKVTDSITTRSEAISLALFLLLEIEPALVTNAKNADALAKLAKKIRYQNQENENDIPKFKK